MPSIDKEQQKKVQLALAEFDKIRSQYEEKRQSSNFFIYGFPGSGKTFSLRTARKPILLYQFDPNGALGLQDMVDSGDLIIADFSENFSDPNNFARWEQTFMEHDRKGLFDFVGTAVIDSLTFWTESMQARIMAKNGRAFKPGAVEFYHGPKSNASMLEDRDYGIGLKTTANYIGAFAGVSCDSIVLAHAKEYTNRQSQITTIVPLLAGQLQTIVPSLFDEVYIADVKKSSGGYEYIWHTYPHKRYIVGRSRFKARAPKIQDQMPQDFKNILKLAGMDAEDLIIETTEQG